MSIKYKDISINSIKYKENDIKNVIFKDKVILEGDKYPPNFISRNLWFWLDADNTELTLNEGNIVSSARYKDVVYNSDNTNGCTLVDGDTGYGASKMFYFDVSSANNCRLSTPNVGDSSKTQLAVILCKTSSPGSTCFAGLKAGSSTYAVGLDVANRRLHKLNGIINVEFLNETSEEREDFNGWVILTVASPYNAGSYFLSLGAYLSSKDATIAEALVYSEIPTESELCKITSYLKKKWFNIDFLEDGYYSEKYNSFSKFRAYTYTPNSIIDNDGVFVKSVSDTKYREPSIAIPSATEKANLTPVSLDYPPVISYLNSYKVLDFNNTGGSSKIKLTENLPNQTEGETVTFFIVFKVAKNLPADKIMSIIGSYKDSSSAFLGYDTTLKIAKSRLDINTSAKFIDLYHKDIDAGYEDWTILAMTTKNSGYYFPQRVNGVGIVGSVANQIGFAGSIAEIGYINYGLNIDNRKLLIESLKEKYNI